MQKIKRCFLLFLFAICTSPAQASETASDLLLKRISTQVAQHAVVHANFVQTKRMTALKRPLVTSGKLTFLRDHGVRWQIEKPFRMTYLLSGEKIVEIDENGVRKERGQNDVPGLAQIGRVFQAMLGADNSVLHEYFHVTAKGNEKQWHITLKPRQQHIAQFLTQLELDGSRFVDTIRITENGGDSTLIRFTHNRGAATASKADKQSFLGKPGS